MHSNQKLTIRTRTKLFIFLAVLFLVTVGLIIFVVVSSFEQTTVNVRTVIVATIGLITLVLMGMITNSSHRKLTIDGDILTETSGIVAKRTQTIDLHTITKVTAATSRHMYGAYYSLNLYSADNSTSMSIPLSSYSRQDAKHLLSSLEWFLQTPGILDNSEETQKTLYRIHPDVALPTTPTIKASQVAAKRSPRLKLLGLALSGIVMIGIFGTLIYSSVNERENCKALTSRGATTTAVITGLRLKHNKATVASPSEATSIELQLSYEAGSVSQSVTRTISFDSNTNLMNMYNDIQSGRPLPISYLPEKPTVMKFNTLHERDAPYMCS